MRTLVIALFLSVPLAATAAAQDRPAPAATPDASYTFDDHDVDGGRYEHGGSLITWRPQGDRRSLVRPRVHFVPELLKSVERL
jgi:hypothetical protein